MTEMFNKKKELIKKKINSIQIVAKIDQLSQLVTKKMELLATITSVGKSSEESDEFLSQSLEIESDAHEISEQCLKAVARCQNTSSIEHSDQSSFSMDCSIKAYQVLEQCAELQELLDVIKLVLQSASKYFKDSLKIFECLVTLDNEVAKIQANPTQSVIDGIISKTRDIVKKILEDGSLLIKQAEPRMNTDGVR